jgi:hypothetical protein
MIFAPSFPDTETNEVIEAARDAINDPLASYESKRRAILTLKEYAREGHQKARIILLNYSRLVTGNPRLQKLASDP